MRSFRSLVIALALVPVAASGCAGARLNNPAESGYVTVAAAENVWGDIAAQIGGPFVRVASILDSPTVDPHLFEATPATVGVVTGSDLVIENGAGYDDFVDRILAADPRSSRRLVDVARVLGVGSAGNPNPHLWYWTSRLPVVAHAIAERLRALDPRHAAAFASGERRFDASLAPLQRTIADIRRRFGGTPVGFTERLPGYLLSAAGLPVATPIDFSRAVEDGSDPSPQAVAAFDSAITGHRIRVLIANSQVTVPATRRAAALARRSGVPVVGMSELLPRGVDFQTWQLRQVDALLAALETS